MEADGKILLELVGGYARLEAENMRLKAIVDRVTPFWTSHLIDPRYLNEEGYLDHCKLDSARLMGGTVLQAITFRQLPDTATSRIDLRGNLDVVVPQK